MLLILLLWWGLLTIEILLALPIFYLCIVSVSALFMVRKRRANQQHLSISEPIPSFAILIPAHNEEVLLGTLLTSLQGLKYPQDCYNVHVVADNCTDKTASIARNYVSVQVHERTDTQKRGKGYALSWLMQRLEADHQYYDAYLILDADSVVVPVFLEAMAHELQKGALALQGHNTVLNTTEAPGTILRWLALTLMNHLRPLGRNGLGGSSTITGNGACLSRALLTRFPWESYALSEDYHYYLRLVQEGIRVQYVPEALVRSHMPTSFSQMRTQDIRWEAHDTGDQKWHTTWKLLKAGLQYGDRLRLEAIAELLTPPLSLLLGGSLFCLLAAIFSGPGLLLWLGCSLIAGLVCYLATGLTLMRMPLSGYRALLYAPGFLVWKLWVYFVLSRSKKHTSQWIRTSRPDSPSSSIS